MKGTFGEMSCRFFVDERLDGLPEPAHSSAAEIDSQAQPEPIQRDQSIGLEPREISLSARDIAVRRTCRHDNSVELAVGIGLGPA